MINQLTNTKTAYVPTLDGQERLATQQEREDVKLRIGARGLEKRAVTLRTQVANSADTQREAGDQVNRFLLCTLVNESSRHIKANAQRAGEPLPMPMIVRGVLRSYRLAAMEKSGPLANPTLDLGGLNRLHEKVLRGEIARHSLDRVKNSEVRLARAERLGDEARIKIEKGGLEQAIEARARIAGAFR